MIKLRNVLFFSVLTLTSLTVSAADWYKVEVVVFSNQDSAPLADEYWPDIQEIPPQENAVNLQPPSAEDNAYQQLPSNALSLHDEKKRLLNSGPYKILFHAGWTQPVYRTQNPLPIHVTGGDILDNGMYELDGYLAVGRGTYLHFRPNLFLSRKLNTDEVALLQSHKKTNPIDSEQTAPVITMQPSSSARNTLANELFPTIPDILTVNLNQARRMKSKELHYIDHPLMGILVEIKPVK